MKYKNKTLNAVRTINVQLPRGLDNEAMLVKVTGAPFGIEEMFAEIWPQVVPKFRTIQKNSSQKPTQEVANQKEIDDSERDRNIAFQAYRLYIALRSDTNIQFDNEPVDQESLMGLVAEFRDSGLSPGDVQIILGAAMHASNLDDDTWEDITKHFV